MQPANRASCTTGGWLWIELQHADFGRLGANHTRPQPLVALDLLNPSADRLDPIPELIGGSADRSVRHPHLGQQRAGHPHRCGLSPSNTDA